VHQLKDFEEKTIKSTQKRSSTIALTTDAKKKLNALASNAIIEDGRSFNDLNKSGNIKLFNSLCDGKLELFPTSLTIPKY
jgi:predicted lactoylglutathione lyase